MEDCIFCKIISGADKDRTIIYEDQEFFVMPSKYPVYDTHILLLTKKHITSIELSEDSDQTLLGGLLIHARRIAKERGIKDYKLAFNNGKYQHVPHIHLHLIAGDTLGEGGV